jgi:hypothetical protein
MNPLLRFLKYKKIECYVYEDEGKRFYDIIPFAGKKTSFLQKYLNSLNNYDKIVMPR